MFSLFIFLQSPYLQGKVLCSIHRSMSGTVFIYGMIFYQFCLDYECINIYNSFIPLLKYLFITTILFMFLKNIPYMLTILTHSFSIKFVIAFFPSFPHVSRGKSPQTVRSVGTGHFHHLYELNDSFPPKALSSDFLYFLRSCVVLLFIFVFCFFWPLR